MAWVSTSLTADQIAFAAADKPLVGVRNIFPTDIISVTWKDAAFASKTDSNESRCYDGLTGLYTAPTGATATTWHLDFISTGNTPFDFCSFIINEAAAAVTSVAIKIADDSAHTVRAETIGTMATTAGVGRGIDLTLGDAGNPAPNSYSGVAYLRLTFTLSIAANPSISEIFIGSRVQLAHNPRLPWDEKNLSGNTTIHEAHNGSQNRYVYSKGKRDVVANLQPSIDARADDIESIYTLSDYGNAPLIWVPKPNSAPNAFNLMHHRSPSFRLPYVGFTERNTVLDLEEQAPHYQSGDA